MRPECENIQKNISGFIQWKESDEGMKVDLPNIDKFHKYIIFKYWEMQLRQAGKTTSKATNLTNEIIEFVNGQILKTELIKEYTSEELPELKPLESQWNKITETQVETIKNTNKFDQEKHWNFLIKPYHQCLTL